MNEFRIKLKQNCCFLPRFVLRCVGLSLNTNETFLYKTYSFLVIAIASTFPFNNHLLLVQNLDDFDATIYGIFTQIGSCVTIAKIFFILSNRKHYEHVLNEVEKIQRLHNTRLWSQELVHKINKLILGFLVMFYTSWLYFFVRTLVARIINEDHSKWKLPISEVAYINTSYSPNFELAWTVQIVTEIVLDAGFCISDILLIATIIDMCVQFKIVAESIQNVAAIVKNPFFKIMNQCQNIDNSERQDLHESLKKTIIHHSSLIELTEKLDNTFSTLIFLDVIGNLCLTCLSLYYASVLPLFDPRALKVYLEIVSMVNGLFFVCYWGSEISLASQSVGTACYEANFIIGTDPEFKKSLMLIMIRSQKPIALSVGKFTKLSIDVFAWIIRSSYSFFMVLRKTNKNLGDTM